MPRVKASTKVKVPTLLANGDEGDAVVSSTTTSINEAEEQPVKAVTKGRGRGKKVAAEQEAAATEDVKAVSSNATTSGRGRKKALVADVQDEISEESAVKTKAVSKVRGKKASSTDLGGDTDAAAAVVPVAKTAANRRKKAEASTDAEVTENNIGDTNVIAVKTTKKSSTVVGRGRKKNVAEEEPVETEVAVKLEAVETEEKAAAKKIKVEIDTENSIDTPTVNPADNKTKAKKTSKTTKSKKDAANGEATEAVVKTAARGRKRAVDAAAEIIDEEAAEIDSPKKKIKKDAVKKPEKKARVTKSKKAAEEETVQNEEVPTEAEALSDIATTSTQQKPTKRQRLPKATATADDNQINDAVAVAKPEKKTRVTKAKKADEKEAQAEEIPEEENSAATSQQKAAPKRLRQRKAIATAADDEQLDEDEVDGAKPSKSKRKAADAAPLNATDTIYNKSDFDLPALEDDSVAGKRYNLKISSWNVAGLRSWLKKDGLKFLEYEEPDIFCLQETKCTTDQLPEEAERIPGYHPYWLCMPGGYAGVAIYSKIMPINVEYGIGNKEFDDVGRIITAEYEKFFLVCVYVPNSGRKLVNLEARMRWEKLFQVYVQKLDARKPVIISGDMNVSHLEIDLANPKTNTRSAGFTKEERDQMSALLALGYVDTFRHLYPERTGAYTYWTYMSNARARNVGWRLDYFLVSERYRKRVVDNCIRAQCKGSDHCPITLFLNL